MKILEPETVRRNLPRDPVRADKIVSRLNSTTDRFEDIAKEFGVTRQRIEQIGRAFNAKPGWMRQQERTARKEAQKPESKFVQRLRACLPEGFSLEVLTAKEVLVNGHSCCVVNACWHRIGGRNYAHFQFPGGQSSADFSIAIGPPGAFIVPRHRWTVVACFVCGRKKDISGANGTTHDWPIFKDAWHLLSQK
mgnify:FL=1